MKQHITKEQWDELNLEEGQFLMDALKLYSSPRRRETELISIGQMIEFLGEDLWFGVGKRTKCIDFEFSGELCDALWGEVKYKLSNTK